MSKTIIMICLGIMIINLIAGCTVEESETITIGVFEGLETAYTEMVNSEGFKSAFPDVNVRIQCETFEDHHNRLIVQLTEGQGTCEIETVEIEMLGRVIATEGLTDLSLPPFKASYLS
ncbi:MAG: hypothetical protein JXJ04_16570 [Spirochaetales bacterium]|nr:hypothetical protein [Spirochaetales bacterium]